MVEGMVGGEEDRMTMKTSDLPVCIAPLYTIVLQMCTQKPPQSRPHPHDFISPPLPAFVPLVSLSGRRVREPLMINGLAQRI